MNQDQKALKEIIKLLEKQKKEGKVLGSEIEYWLQCQRYRPPAN